MIDNNTYGCVPVEESLVDYKGKDGSTEYACVHHHDIYRGHKQQIVKNKPSPANPFDGPIPASGPVVGCPYGDWSSGQNKGRELQYVIKHPEKSFNPNPLKPDIMRKSCSSLTKDECENANLPNMELSQGSPEWLALDDEALSATLFDKDEYQNNQGFEYCKLDDDKQCSSKITKDSSDDKAVETVVIP